MKVFRIVMMHLALILLVGLLVSFPIMLLWNYCLVPAVWGMRDITWLQAYGIYILSICLFKTSISYKEHCS